MNYTEKEVMDYVNQEDVKFIRLAFCDPFGRQKNISILPEKLDCAFKYGIPFDVSAIEGFGNSEDYTDLVLYPDPSTLSLLPWRPSHGKVVRMYCYIKHSDGTPFVLDCRQILINAVDKAMTAGISCEFGAEIKFYLFRTDENGNKTNIPFDNAGYMDVAPLDCGENIRREICLIADEMGTKPLNSHHEEGPGQNKIDFCYSNPLTAADNAITMKNIISTTAARNGLFASFRPRPIKNNAGSGMHIIVIPEGKDSSCYESFTAGIMKHISEITAFLNPTVDSYERLNGERSPRYIARSEKYRSQLIRMSKVQGHRKFIKLRSPDANTNPYLAYALIIYAGLEGVLNSLVPPDIIEENLYFCDKSILDKIETLPKSFNDAAILMKNSSFVNSILPADIIKLYSNLI